MRIRPNAFVTALQGAVVFTMTSMLSGCATQIHLARSADNKANYFYSLPANEVEVNWLVQRLTYRSGDLTREARRFGLADASSEFHEFAQKCSTDDDTKIRYRIVGAKVHARVVPDFTTSVSVRANRSGLAALKEISVRSVEQQSVDDVPWQAVGIAPTRSLASDILFEADPASRAEKFREHLAELDQLRRLRRDYVEPSADAASAKRARLRLQQLQAQEDQVAIRVAGSVSIYQRNIVVRQRVGVPGTHSLGRFNACEGFIPAVNPAEVLTLDACKETVLRLRPLEPDALTLAVAADNGALERACETTTRLAARALESPGFTSRLTIAANMTVSSTEREFTRMNFSLYLAAPLVSRPASDPLPEDGNPIFPLAQ